MNEGQLSTATDPGSSLPAMVETAPGVLKPVVSAAEQDVPLPNPDNLPKPGTQRAFVVKV